MLNKLTKSNIFMGNDSNDNENREDDSLDLENDANSGGGDDSGANTNTNENARGDSEDLQKLLSKIEQIEAQNAELAKKLSERNSTKEIEELRKNGEELKAFELELSAEKQRNEELQATLKEFEEKQIAIQEKEKEINFNSSLKRELEGFESFKKEATDDAIILLKTVFSELDKNGNPVAYNEKGELIKNEKGGAYSVSDFLNDNIKKRYYFFNKAADHRPASGTASDSAMTRSEFRSKLAAISGQENRAEFIKKHKGNLVD